MAPVLEKEIPWCTAFLCIGAMLSHTFVLVGNMDTAKSMADMGHSVDGWSEVGLATSTSLSSELDHLLTNVSFVLTKAVERTMKTQALIDSMLSLFGDTTGMVLESISLTDHDERGFLLLQTDGAQNTTDDPVDIVMPLVIQALQALPEFQNGLVHLQGTIEQMKPALVQVGEWVESFSDKVQATVEIFGTTMDRVQKIFDQVMTQISGVAGEGEDLMLHDTFNLFDMDSSGKISVADLRVLADIYSVVALGGQKGADLVEHYDVNGDGEIDKDEFPNLVDDSSVTGIMATVLREYSKRLSMVAGNVGSARMRAEVSLNVVQYFQLVCSKNLTKVAWVSQMLTNGTLPIEFTADVMAQLALEKDDPDILTEADVGQMVVGMMMTLDDSYTLKALDLMSTPEHWESEGFNPDDQADAVETVTNWTATGPDFVESLKDLMASLKRDAKARGEKLPSLKIDDVAQAMPEAAKVMTQARVEEFQRSKLQSRMAKRMELFGTEHQQILLVELLHGVAATDGGAPDMALRALNKGVMAKPETLEFAQWLKNNASTNANRFQQQCFNYTGQSSNALDAFNTRIQGMVKKISGFIDIMKAYATPAGIDKLEAIVEEFAANGMSDVFAIVKKVIKKVLKGKWILAASSAASGKTFHGQQGLLQIDVDTINPHIRLRSNHSDKVVASSAFMKVEPVQSSMAAPRPHVQAYGEGHQQGHVLVKVSDNATVSVKKSGVPQTVFKNPGHHVEKVSDDAKAVVKKSGIHHMALQNSGHLLETSSDGAKTSVKTSGVRQKVLQNPGAAAAAAAAAGAAAGAPGTAAGVAAGAAAGAAAGSPVATAGIDMFSGVWDKVSNMLREFESVVPQALDTVRFARQEVSATASTMDSLFGTLKTNGPPIFEQASMMYKLMWMLYFFFVMPLTLGLLFYGFWGSGYFGGPVPNDDGYEAPQGFCAKVCACFASCGACMRGCHDSHLYMWSFIICFQVFVLLLFVVSLVFVVLAGIHMFVGNGCSQIYLIADHHVCQEALGLVSTFLTTFTLGDGTTPLSMTCDHYSLLTCRLIHDKLLAAAKLTVVGSFVAAFFSFQLVFDAAMMHERIRWRRMLASSTLEKGEGAAA